MIGDCYINNSFKSGYVAGVMPYVFGNGNSGKINDFSSSYFSCSFSAIFALRSRLALFSLVYVVSLLLVVYRLLDIAVFNSTDEGFVQNNLGSSYQRQMIRGNILDRNGFVIATSISTFSLYADCKYVYNPKESAAKIAKVLGLSDQEEKRLAKRLASRRRFLWVARHLSPRKKAEIIRLGLTGFEFISSQKRFYPYGRVTSHLLGYTNIDNVGKLGLEASYDNELKSPGYQLQTTIDIRIQSAVHQELSKAMEKFKAKAANAIVMDTKSGEIIAMVSLNDFNPNRPINPRDRSSFDINTMGLYEHGSVMKIFNTAMVLEHKVATLGKYYDATKPLRLAGFRVRDFRSQKRWLSVKDIFRYSSNIGSALMALEAGKDIQRSFLEKVGLLSSLDIDLPYSPEPQYPKVWRDANTATIAYGYGIANTPLQLITAANAIINDGKLMRPTFILDNVNPRSSVEHNAVSDDNFIRQVVSESTSATMRALMHYTVNQGSGRYARVKNYFVGGKTGTANLRVNGQYQRDKHLNRTSFIAFIGESLNKPQYTILVSLDGPQALKSTHGYSAAGWNAAPTAGKIMKRIINIVGIRPDLNASKTRSKDINSLIKLASYKR